MIPLPSGTKIWLVAGITDMRNGFNGLAAKVQTALKDDPMSGHVFIFRSGSQVKLLANHSRNHSPAMKNGCYQQSPVARTAAVR